MTASMSGSAEKLETRREMVVGWMHTSASIKKITSPAASRAPRFRACAGPLRPPLDRTRAPNWRAMLQVSSLEPSSTTTHSKGWISDAAMASRHAGNVVVALYAGITIETLGNAISLGTSNAHLGPNATASNQLNMQQAN